MMSMFEKRVEAACEAYPRWITDDDGPEVPWSREPEQLKREYRHMMRAALRAADAVIPDPIKGFEVSDGTKVSTFKDGELMFVPPRGVGTAIHLTKEGAQAFREFFRHEAADAVVTEEELERVLSGAFQGWTDQDDPFGDQARAVLTLLRGGAK